MTPPASAPPLAPPPSPPTPPSTSIEPSSGARPLGDIQVIAEPMLWIHRWNEGLLSFRLRRDANYQFLPGQFARIGLKQQDGETLWRAYSIVSAPHEAWLEFFLVVLPSGEFSQRIARCAVGDTVLVEQLPQGFFTVNRFRDPSPVQDLWLIATGTGLAPYLSMLRDPVVWQRFANIVLVLSVRTQADLAYEAELYAYQARETGPGQARFRYVKTLTRERAPEACEGRIDALIESGELERRAGVVLSDARSRFMLCGNPEMVEGMRKLLKSRGYRMNRKLEAGHIIVENYW